jgi:hypothetical protein
VVQAPTGRSAGDHVCWPFRDRGGLAAVARAFVAEGLERDERVAYVGQGRPCELRQDLSGIANLEDCLDRGQLQVTDIAAMPASDPLTDPVDELIDLAVMTRDSRRGWEARMAELLLGGRRTGRDQTVQDPDPGNAFSGGAIYLSLPGLGDRLAARVAGEIGEHIDQFDSPKRPAVLRRPCPGHTPLRQDRLRRRPPAGAQPLPRRRGAPMGVLQPATQRLGPRVLRPEDRRRQEPPRGPARAGQPLAESSGTA